MTQGDLGGAADLINPFSLLGGAATGIAERRSWSNNLKDLGVDETASTWGGLALDIALDPFWLIPGGSIAAGLKGTTKGAITASAANRAGAKLAPDAFKTATEITQGFEGQTFKNKLPLIGGNVKFSGGKTTAATEELANLFPSTGKSISSFSQEGLNNFLQGIRQGNIEEYSNWSKLRQQKKELKALKKQGAADVSEAPIGYSPLETLSKGIAETVAKTGKVVEDQVGNAAERAANATEDVLNKTVETQKLPDPIKDNNAVQEIIDNATNSASINKMARENIGPIADEYNVSRGIDAPQIDFKAIQASDVAPALAKIYDEAVSAPNDPQVQAAYAKLVSEVEDQYKFLEEKGVQFEYVDYEPYLGPNGVVDSRLMMQDVAANKHMFVRSSAPDYEKFGAHPMLTAEQNDKFRAVHDYFGHAASGRGFGADGEEAAWVAHSRMFSPEARRAMTTETRGQNSYYNFFDPENKQFAEQKAFLLPEEFITTPLENATILEKTNDAVLKSNSFIGRMTSLLTNFADEMIYELGMISTPMKGVTRYTPEQISDIEAAITKYSDTSTHKATSEVGKHALSMVEDLRKYINEPTAYNLGRLAVKDGTRIQDETAGINGIIQLIQDAANATTNTNGLAIAAAALKMRLDQPIDATNLIIDGLKAEGRTVKAVDAFKPTIWSTKANGGYGASEVSKAKLERYFPEDPLLANPQQLGIALGTLPLDTVPVAGKGERTLLARKRQEMIWADFRTRNADRLQEVSQLEKVDWEAANSIPNSELFKVMADGTPVGQGLLPKSIPAGTVRTQNGIPRTSLSAILENIGKVVQRAPRGLAATPETAVARSLETTLDVYPPELQKWITAELGKISKEIKAQGLIDTKAVRSAVDAETVALQMYKEVPAIRTLGDARILATGGTKALKELAKSPKQRFYIAAPEDFRTGLPDTSQIGRVASATGARGTRKVVTRDPLTGVPVDAKGAPTTEAKAAQAGDETQYRITADAGKPFTGRAAGKWAPQTGKGPQQLAGLQAIRETLANINTGIAAKELTVTPEHAQLLGSVMTMIGIKISPNATPNQIFKLFKQEAATKFEDTIQGLESAAKAESVTYQLKSIFSARNIMNIAENENISIMKAIERTNIEETQTAVVNWTDDAISLVDESCAQNYAKLDVADIVSQVRKPLG